MEGLNVLGGGPVGHVGSVVFSAKVEDGAEIESTEELKVAFVRVAGAVDTARDHGEVERWDDEGGRGERVARGREGE